MPRLPMIGFQHLALTAQGTGGGTNYVVQTPTAALYIVFIDGLSDISFVKSTDHGKTWDRFVVAQAASATNLSIWYDRWSNISAGLIHVAYTESTNDDTLYFSINTESSDTVSTQTTIFAGTSTAAGGQLSIVRARGGNLYCRTCIDAGAEGGFFRSTDVGATWGSRTNNEILATQDQMILLPGWGADNQDIMAFFWDASANEISRQLNDDSADTWSETSIATSMSESSTTLGFPHFAAAVDITNSKNWLLAWSGIDTANSDLRCWHVTESAITEVTNVVLNSTDDQGFAAISIDQDTGDLYAFYAGKSDGSETYSTSMHIYYKVSKDGGSTWGAESRAVPALTHTSNLIWLATTPRFRQHWDLCWLDVTGNPHLWVAPEIGYPRAVSHIGL